MIFTPTPQQKEAIEHPPAPLMIIAGAGTGKTATLIYRIKYLIDTNHAHPNEIVVLTFTEKATGELRQRIRDTVGKTGEAITISTFHSFCNKLVREFSDSEDADKLLWKEPDITNLFVKRFDDLHFLTSRSFRADPIQSIREGFLPFFNRIQDELLSTDVIANLFSFFNLEENLILDLFPSISDKIEPDEVICQFTDLVKVYEWYQDEKKKLGVVDYGDMILDCWEMLNNKENILQKVRNCCRHIIIDEYQDNNYALNKVVNLIAAENPSITVVGDEDQCIYSFRGANYYNISDFRKRYKNTPNYSEIQLTENHRSTQEILDIANSSIDLNPVRTKKVLVSHENRRGPKPVWHVSERLQTLSKIPEIVKELVESYSVQFGDIAVICRGWGHVISVADALKQNSIPVDVHVERFFNVPMVKDVLAWSHLILNNNRTETSLYRILQSHVGESFTREFYQANKNADVKERFGALSALSENDLTGDQFQQVQWILETRKKLMHELKKHKKADEMFWTILELLKQTKALKTIRHNYRYKDRLNLANLGELMSIAESFSTREKCPSLEAWLAYMDILQLNLKMEAVQPATYDKNIAVQVMTIHASKGLQFPVVLVPFLRAGSFPGRRQRAPVVNQLPDAWKKWPRPENTTTDDEHIYEERRIFYVACTRAMNELYLFGPEKAQSLFTKELESENVMEVIPMTKITESSNEINISEAKQKLLVELSREIAAHQYENVSSIVEGLKQLDETGNLAQNHPYSFVTGPNNEEREKSPERMLNLSASAIEEYDKCPLKYRLDKEDKVPERKSKVTLEFGSIIHNTLDELHRAENQSLDNLLKLLDKHWRSEAFEYLLREQEFKKQGQEILIAYHNWIQDNPPTVVATERWFEFVVEEINVRITGKIDRIDEEDGPLAVVDYKTSKNKSSAKGSLQLALYTEAIKRDAVEGISGSPGTASLHFLRHADDPLSSHRFTEADLMKQMKKVGKVSEGIRKGEFEPKPSDFHCTHCDYREFLCPAWEE